jgi:hypothetical protein
MAFLLLLLAAVLLACGMLTSRGRATGPLALIPQAGAALVVAGAVALAWFVFSGDPYVNGDMSRWSRRDSHLLVYVAWIGSAIVAPLLWRQGARGDSSRAALFLALASAVVMVQAVAAVSQDVN